MAIVGGLLAVTVGVVIMLAQNAQTIIPYQDAGITAAWIPPTVKRWEQPIEEMSKKYNINANLVAILMTMESGGDPNAKSEVGATGLMQIMPTTAADIAKQHLKEPVQKYELEDPKTNIEFGVAYLAMLRDEFGSMQHAPDFTRTVELVAAGYNGGGGTANALEKGEGLRDPQPVIYSRDAFNMWRERVSAKSPTFDRWKERGGDKLLADAAKFQK